MKMSYGAALASHIYTVRQSDLVAGRLCINTEWKWWYDTVFGMNAWNFHRTNFMLPVSLLFGVPLRMEIDLLAHDITLI
jgi:hypothetical protein